MSDAIENRQKETSKKVRMVLAPLLGFLAIAMIVIIWIGIVGCKRDKVDRIRTADRLRQLPRERWVDTLANERYPNELLKLLGDGYVFKAAGPSYPIVEANGKAAEIIWVITPGTPNKFEKYKRVPLNSP
ncbi:MAG: hypothetical protein WCG99_04325 [Candidatus Berkelbacteria bacterium]